MWLNTNVGALSANTALNQNVMAQDQTIQQIATGNRITSAASDPSGLAISELMTSQISGLNQANQNAQNGVSLLQTADGAMSNIDTILQSMRSLASEAATGTNNASDLQNLQAEMNQYAKEITNITNTTQFNNINLLAGGFQNQNIQIGANQGQSIGMSLGALDASTLGVTGYSANVSADTTGVSGVTLGSGLSSGSTYQVALKGTASAVGSIAGNLGTAAFATGSVTGTYEGSGNTTYSVSVVTNTAGSFIYTVSGSDGYSASTTTAAGLTSLSINDAPAGATLTLAIGNTTASGQAVTFTMDAATYSAQMTNGGTNVGGAATGSAYGAGTITVGDTSSGANATGQVLSFNLQSAGLALAALKTVGAVAFSGSTTVKVATDGAAATPGPDGSLPNANYATAGSGINVTTQASAQTAITQIDKAIQTVDTQRANAGAWMNALQFAGQNASTEATNLQQANAGYLDANMAQVSAQFVQQNTLVQADVGVAAQANQLPAQLLKLIP